MRTFRQLRALILATAQPKRMIGLNPTIRKEFAGLFPLFPLSYQAY